MTSFCINYTKKTDLIQEVNFSMEKYGNAKRKKSPKALDSRLRKGGYFYIYSKKPKNIHFFVKGRADALQVVFLKLKGVKILIEAPDFFAVK